MKLMIEISQFIATNDLKKSNTSSAQFYSYCHNIGLIVNVSKTFHMNGLESEITLYKSSFIRINQESIK